MAVVAIATLAACGGSDATVGRAEFVAGVIEREDVPRAAAECTADYVFAEYDDPEIEAIHRDGMLALPVSRWGSYGQSLLACAAAPGLGVPLRTPDE